MGWYVVIHVIIREEIIYTRLDLDWLIVRLDAHGNNKLAISLDKAVSDYFGERAASSGRKSRGLASRLKTTSSGPLSLLSRYRRASFIAFAGRALRVTRRHKSREGETIYVQMLYVDASHHVYTYVRISTRTHAHDAHDAHVYIIH